jgi:uncharacterized protein YjgD (DUF1641 family)
MNEQNIQQQIDDVNRKLDIILEEMEFQRRHRREMEDLKEDLMRVGKDVYHTAVVELEDVHDYLKTGDVMYLGKKLLRNVNTLTATIEQLESLRDFFNDSAPLARETFIDFMHRLDALDRKGYFGFAKELGNVTDNIVTSFSKEDVKALGDNIVTILNTVKSMTQPDMLHAINNALNVYKKLDMEITDNVSFFSLLKELNTPEAKKGLAFAIRFLKSIASLNHVQPTHG